MTAMAVQQSFAAIARFPTTALSHSPSHHQQLHDPFLSLAHSRSSRHRRAADLAAPIHGRQEMPRPVAPLPGERAGGLRRGELARCSAERRSSDQPDRGRWPVELCAVPTAVMRWPGLCGVSGMQV